MTELPTRERFIEAARAMAPALAERAAETENLRRLPEANVEAIVDAGLHRIYQPARYGGAEMTYDNRRHFMLTEWIPGTDYRIPSMKAGREDQAAYLIGELPEEHIERLRERHEAKLGA